MSYVQMSVAWVRHNFSWSNSAQSWIERGVGAVLVLAVVGLLLLGNRLGTMATFTLWGLLAVSAAVLLRRGWLQLFGPVLFYDMLCTARRGRYFLIRCLYSLLLLLVLFSVYTSISPFTRHSARDEAAQIAMHYFEMFTLVQWIAVVLLTPAYVAGAVAEEKERKTLEFLLATDLRNREIILSKFGSRLANLTLFLLTGLPILSFLQFLGGIDPDLLLASFGATAMTGVGLASLSILNSVTYRRPRDAIAMTYLMVVAYFAVATTLYGFAQVPGLWPFAEPIWFGEGAPTIGNAVEVVNAGNILVALIEIERAGRSTTGALGTTVPSLLWHYALFHGTLCVVCLAWSIARLRAVALRQGHGRTEKLRWHQRYRPPVGDLPVLWKELIVEGGLRINWVGWLAVILLVLLTVGIGVSMVVYFFWIEIFHPGQWHGGLVEEMNIWVRIAGTGVACVTLLAVAVRASTTIRSEMDKDTFDALITTPLSSDAILLGKFVGCLFSVRFGWFWLGAILGLGLMTGGLHMLALPLFLGAWVVYAVVFAMIGLWFSMWCRTSMRATVMTMLTTIGLSVGHWLVWPFCCLPLFLMTGLDRGVNHAGEYIAKFQAGITPPFVLGWFAYSPENLARDFNQREFPELMGFSLLGLFLWSMFGLMLWFVLIGPRFRHLTRRDQSSWEAE